MTMRTIALVLAAVSLAQLMLPPATAQEPGTDPVRLSAVRFYQASQGATTIEVLGEVQLRAVAPASGPTARYRVEVAVMDSTGTMLAGSGWDREISTQVARLPGASSTESFTFAAAPGRYTVRFSAAPAGGTAIQRELAVRAFASRPPVSDLLLATAAREIGADSLAPGEVRRGTLALRTAPLPKLSLDSAQISYYAEVYPWQGAAVEGQLRVEVIGAGGRRLVATPPRPMRVGAAGGAARGSLDLTGLPEGQFVFRVLATIGDSTTVLEAPFAVARRPAVVAAAPAAAPVDVFEGMSEAALDSLYGPLQYLLDESERGVFNNLSREGKRRFVREVFARRNPTPGAPDNPAVAEFLSTVAYVNQAFRGSGAGNEVGWATDRGRIYLRNGRPDETLRRPVALPRPYEVWKFTRGRMRWYVFWDQSGLSNYRLIGSNDPREPTMMDWEQRLGPEGTLDVREFIR